MTMTLNSIKTAIILLMILVINKDVYGKTNMTELLKIPDFYQQQIEQNRKSDFTLTVIDKYGSPITNATVKIEMKEHDFMFGTAVSARRIIGAEETKYRTHVKDLFNTVVFENNQKWKMWEDIKRRSETDEALKWIENNNLRLRGHTLIWQTFNFGTALPKDVENAVKTNDPQYKTFVRERIKNHILAITQQVGIQAEHWDVANEQAEEAKICEFLTPNIPTANSPDLQDWHKLARQGAPNAKLYVNDYHILVGDYTNQKNEYEEQIRFMQKNNTPIDGIGFQGHFHGQNLLRTREQLWETLEQFGKFNLPMTITEYDTFGGDWPEGKDEKERIEAEFFHRLLTTFFAYPQAEGFIVWGFWDEQHWANNAPFFRKDWSAKPALNIYNQLVFHEWITNEEAQTDSKGQCRFRAFNGIYKTTITAGEKSYTIKMRINPNSKQMTISIKQ